jgi:hypothetical protein
VFVYLPTLQDVRPGFWAIGGDYSTFRAHIGETIAAQGDLFIDLTPALAAYDGQRQELFIQPGEVPHRGAAGHYSAIGNRYMAESLWGALMKLDTIRAGAAAVWGSPAP